MHTEIDDVHEASTSSCATRPDPQASPRTRAYTPRPLDADLRCTATH
jgi:hypothetical protein